MTKYSFCMIIVSLLIAPKMCSKKIPTHTSLDTKTQIVPAGSSVITSHWLKVQKKAKDTVVQLFVEISVFNWKKPFKTPRQDKASGSGFFINKDGYMVSNHHVINEATSVKIQIPSLGKERFDVEVVGVCPDRDLALLRLTSAALSDVKKKLGKVPYLKLGDSDRVLRTHEVLALGYPLGQEKLKSTQGIVSGREDSWGESYIQTTAPINPGNSGGPALNHAGEVIGINTATVLKAQNVGYIIPINDVKNVIEDLHEVQLLRKPFLGAQLNNSTKDMVQFLRNPEPGGYLIARVYKDTLLDAAGVQSGDMIYRLNSLRFDMYGEAHAEWSEDKVHITSVINRFKLHQPLELEVYRNGERKIVNFTFDLIRPLPIRTFFPEFEHVDYEIIAGMVVMELSLNHIAKFEYVHPEYARFRKREHQYDSQLIITSLLNDSQAQKARSIEEGALIELINGVKVGTLKEFRQAVKKDQKFLQVVTQSKECMVLAVDKIIEDEYELARKNFYSVSSLVNELQIRVKKSIKRGE